MPSSDIRDILVHDVHVGKKQQHPPSSSHVERVLVYILPGNPGLISFYEPFANGLVSLLKAGNCADKAAIRICGKSYRGFEVATSGKTQGEADTDGGPCMFGLADTIAACARDVESFADPDPSGPPTKVILIGHSVGAYILLELLARRTELKRVDLIGGILVFPTVTYIARSRLGRIITPILSPKWLPSLIGLLANAVFSLVPLGFLYYFLCLFAWLPPPAAASFAQFLKSQNGVAQTLWLGRDEMKTITDEKWKQDVWGSGLPDDPAVYMYFGQNDPFVPNDARDQLIRSHGEIPGQAAHQEEESRAVIDTHKIPHSWCIAHSDIIAEKLAPWIEVIMVKSLNQ